MATKNIAVLGLLVVALALSGCNDDTLPINQLPESERGYFGQPGNFAVQVVTEDGSPLEAYQMGSESITPPAPGGKFFSFNRGVASEHRQAASVFMRLRLDTAEGVLAVRCESKYGYNNRCSVEQIATNTTWSWYYVNNKSETMPVSRYARENYLNDEWEYFRHFQNIYLPNSYGYSCEPATATTPLTAGSPRLQPWRLPNGSLVRALIGPEDSAVTDTTGGLRIRVRQSAFAKDTGFLGAVVEYRLPDGTQKTLKLNRILPKP